jgi:hypothetical protein
VDEQNFTVPDDLSDLADQPAPDAAERAAARTHAIGMIRSALTQLGLFVPPGQFPTGAPAGVAQGGGSASEDDADIEQGVLAGMLIALGERASLGTDPLDAAAGYEFVARDMDGAHTGRTEDRWRHTLRQRARLSVVLTERPYPSDVAAPNEACRAADDIACAAAQAAAHATAVRFLLQIPADVFADSQVSAISHIRSSIGALIEANYAAGSALARLLTLLPAGGA